MTFTTTIVKGSSNNNIDNNTTNNNNNNNIKSDNNSNVITLKGSIDIVTDFFFTAINSILYQRGIYLPETFKRECKYGITVLTTTDPTLLSYLQQIQEQITVWLLHQQVQKLVLVIKGIDTLETLERWQFNITVTDNNSISKSNKNNSNTNTSYTDMNTENMTPNNQANVVTSKMKGSNSSNALTKTTTTTTTKDLGGKSLKEIHTEIQAIIRQITASVTFLPLLQEPCTFDLLVYTNKDISLSSSSSDNEQKWVDSDPCYIASNNVAQVKLRSFTTSIHTIDSMVSYKDATNDEWDI